MTRSRSMGILYVILGILLGNAMEDNLRRAMVLSNGDFWYLLSSPIAVGLWIAAILGFVAPIFLRRLLKKPPVPATDHTLNED